MKVLTRKYLADVRPTHESPIFSLHCKVHPGTDTEAFINFNHQSLVVCCKLCERIICEQPIPDDREIKS